ncbi:MAG: nucleoside deaminase [Pseudomonadota bacterium]
MTSDDDSHFLHEAIALAKSSVEQGGGPFGAIVTRDGEIIGRGHNSVISDSDPSAHAEVNAIRDAARRLGRPHLDDCVLYSSCEPCPMCLATSLWARIPRIVYAADHTQATRTGFDDTPIAMTLYGAPQPAHCERLQHHPISESGEPFELWLAKADRTPY